jgi:hypothetical protein
MIAIACALAMISGGALAQGSGGQSAAPPKPHASVPTKKKKKVAKFSAPVKVVAPAPQPVPVRVAPPAPPTLMSSALVSPNVTMAGGLLTIDAPNSTLSEVLRGIHTVTGATVEGASPSERVAVRLGPGNPRQVIAALLKGTPYDYFILGSQEHPDAVTRIVLTQSEGSSAQNSVGQRPQPQPPVNEAQDSASGDDSGAQPAGDIQTEQMQQPPQPQPQPQQAQDAPTQEAPKTPEELFKELTPARPAQPAEQPKEQ